MLGICIVFTPLTKPQIPFFLSYVLPLAVLDPNMYGFGQGVISLEWFLDSPEL